MSYLCHFYLIMRSVNCAREKEIQRPRTLIFHRPGRINNSLKNAGDKTNLDPLHCSVFVAGDCLVSSQGCLCSVSLLAALLLWAGWSSGPRRWTQRWPVMDDWLLPWASSNISSSKVAWRKWDIICHVTTVLRPNFHFLSCHEAFSFLVLKEQFMI